MMAAPRLSVVVDADRICGSTTVFARRSGGRRSTGNRLLGFGVRVETRSRAAPARGASHLAYTSDESGRPEVYVVSLPDASDKCQISTDGGAEPIWSPDGQELFYRVGHRMMHVDVRGGPHRAGVPATLFEHRHVPGALTGLANYDVAADAGAFLIVVELEAPKTMMGQVTISPAGLPWAG